MTKVFTTGTFDILHYGHINLLKTAKSFGDYLIVGVNKYKNGKDTYYSIENRVKMLSAIRYVDEVIILENQEEKFKYMDQCDIFAIGDDYKNFSDIEEIKKHIEVKFIERTPDVSTTEIKKHLSDNQIYKTFVIDIDDTIVTVENRDFDNGIPHIDVINKINNLYDNGWKIILFTSRGQKSCSTVDEMYDKYYNITVNWLNKHNVKFNELKFGKPNSDYYVDDKSMSIDEFLNFKEN